MSAGNVPMLLAAANEDAVETGRKVLSRGWLERTHPWYDSQTDEVDLIPLPQPKQQAASWQWPDWLTSFWQWLTEPWTFRVGGWDIGISLMQIIGFILLGLLLAVAIYYLSKLYASKAKHQEASEDEDEGAGLSDADRLEALPFDVPVDRDLLAAARQRYEQGHYREAVILLFSYLLVEMDKHDVIHLAQGKTNRQYLREIGARAMLRALVERTMVAFEAVFFGDHPLDRDGFEACWSQVEQFQRLVHAEDA